MDDATMHLVTGATGQLGSHIAEQLRGAGQRVRALVRPGSDVSFLRAMGVELIEGNLLDADVVRRAAAGVDVVFHCAARVSDWGPWADFEREAADATRNVVAACRSENVPRLLHVSSISVYGHPRLAPGELVNEDAPLGQNFWRWDNYARSKLLAEQIAREYAATTVVRPSWIYGPRDRVTVPRVVRALLERRVPIIGRGDNFLNVIYAGDVADGAIRAARYPAAVGRTYNLSSQGEVRQKDLLDALTDILGLPRITRHVPYGLVIRWALLQETVARLMRRAKPPTITRRAVYLIGRPTQFSTARARNELGWQPRVSVHAGVRHALTWFVSLPENRHISLKLPALSEDAGGKGGLVESE